MSVITCGTVILIPFEPRRLFWHKDAFMSMRHTLLGLLVAFTFIPGTGCEKSGSSGQPAAALTPAKLSPDTIVRVHWLGKNQLGVMASSYFLMRIWELPQSVQLEEEGLARLSNLHWGFSPRQKNGTTRSAALLHSLLADLVWNESYFEIRQAANQSPEMILAVHLNATLEQMWQTNLAAMAQSLAGGRPVPAPDGRFGWTLDSQNPSVHLVLTRVGQWTIVSTGPSRNGLLDEVIARVRHDHTPYVSRAPEDWLEADVDLLRLRALLPQPQDLPAYLAQISLTVTGDGG